MNSTTGADDTALSIAARTSWDRRRVCEREYEMRGRRVVAVAEGRSAKRVARIAWSGLDGHEMCVCAEGLGAYRCSY